VSQQPPNVPHPEFLRPAIVRPDRMGRAHPDPRADPPTQRLDFGEEPTDRLPLTGPDTEPIPTVAHEVAKRRTVDGGHPGAFALALRPVIGSLAGFLSWLIAVPGGARAQVVGRGLVVIVAIAAGVTGVGVAAVWLVAIGFVVVQVVSAAAVSFSPARRRVDVEVPRL
jgi:hypothetical protein